MKPAKLTRGAVSLTAALTLTAGVVLALPSVATAQPNPFDAYEGKKQTEDTKSSNASCAQCQRVRRNGMETQMEETAAKTA